MSVKLSELAHPPLTMAEVDALRRGQPILKGPSKLQIKTAAKPLTVVDDKAFKAIVRKRDRLRCRMCGRKVVVQLAKAANRCEIHHAFGRRGDLRFDDRFAIVVCSKCHEQLTGRVNEKWRMVPVPQTAFIQVDGRRLLDCRGPIGFERIV